MNRLRPPDPAAAPEALRAMREAAGWTQEQAAEAMGVLPAEVAAWEAGAVTDRHQAALMRWRMEQALYEARLPRSNCYWTRANAARLEQMRQAEPSSAARAERLMKAHTRECAACTRVELLRRDLPAPPQPPVQPGPRGWPAAVRRSIDGLPVWLREPVRAVEVGLWVGGGYLFLEVRNRLERDENPMSPMGFALVWASLAWLVFLFRRVAPLFERRPHLAGQVLAAGVALPATLLLGLLGSADPSTASTWGLAVLASVCTGGLLGALADAAQAVDDWDPRDPELSDPSRDEEREVVIPQQARYWKP
ncbi:MAG TPA: helix-turn-helix transcriptional regulator [Longimicrobium sp.]|nr:helix-turn-helix transcriptional regulator [Longimicrobium sp.]